MILLSETDTALEIDFHSRDYQLLVKIGEGGFGRVYKARQQSTGQLVAIKFLTLPNVLLGDKKRRYIERFHREVELISRLNHPNIVQLIDKGQQGELLYAVYEYIEGLSLRDYIADSGPLPPAFAADVMAGVLDALAHAHEKGVIHRDIKPANIMLYKVGATTHVKVLDFGIGTLRHEARQLDYKSITLTQETLGTPSYSAPEQLRGEPPLPQTDIYVWGLVFLECLSGQPTISGGSLAAIFHQQLSPGNVPLGILAGHESASLLRRVLHKKAQERPVSTIELYHNFRKLNFSNLVGKLALQSKAATSESEVLHCLEETEIYDARLSYTRLTERKQISVLSLIISIEHETCVRDEDVDVVDTFHTDQIQQCIDIAIRYGAYYVGHLGDTLLFYFGYPQATENDSRLCARTALDILSNIRKKSALLKQTQGFTCHAQIGINTGVMLSLANNVPEGTVAHDAMKICRQAATNQILCAESVKQLLDAYLYFDNLGVHHKEQLQSIPLFSLRGERHLEAFGFLRGIQKSSAFIGRTEELSALQLLLTQGRVSSPRLAHIQGEAGIGKSRLIFELRNKNQQVFQLVAQCLPEHKNNALHPILNLLRFKYSLDVLVPEQARATLGEAVQELVLNQDEKEQGLQVLSVWLGLPLSEEKQIDNLPPEIQKQRLFTLIAHLLCQSSGQHFHDPWHLFIFEDMHWADPTSLAFIGYLVTSDVFTEANHVWLTTSREPLPNELAQQDFKQLPVVKFNQKDTADFVGYLFEQQPVAAELLSVLLERTDGIPLFIEELVSTLKKQKIVHKVNGEFNFVDSSKQALIPMSLRDSLQQKLDQLNQAKDTAQLAATIGREFSYDLLALASEKEEALLQRELESLISADLIYPQRVVDGDSYIFKHALVRDAAYASISISNREYFHRRIIDTLKYRFSLNDMADFTLDSFKYVVNKERDDSIPFDVLSDHAEKAADLALASHFMLFHAIKNLTLNQYSLAQSACRNIKSLLIDDKANTEVLLITEIVLSQALVSQQGYSAPLVKASYERALQFTSSTTNYQVLAQINYGLFSFYASQGNYDVALDFARKLEQISSQCNVLQIKLIASMSLGLSLFLKGALPDAERYLSQAVTLSEELGSESLLLEFGGHFGGYSRAWYALLQVLKGEPQKALNTLSRAVDVCCEHKQTLSFVYSFPFIEQFFSDLSQAHQQSLDLIELANKSQLGFFQLIGEYYLSWVMGLSASPQFQSEQSEQILAQFEAMELYSFLPRFYAMSVEVNIRLERFEQALKYVNKALSICQEQGHFYYAELYRLKAEIVYLSDANYLKAKRCLLAAWLISERQNAFLWQERIQFTLKQFDIRLFPDLPVASNS